MLTNAADYRYVVNPRPFANGIHGKILPAVDGTAEARVEKYEDYCHLVEALCERLHWEYGYKDEDAIHEISFFDPTSVVASRTPIVNSVSMVGGLRSFHSQIGYPLVPADWDSTPISYPIFRVLRDPEMDADTAWKNMIPPVVFASNTNDVSRTVDGDTLRRLYRDLDNAKRWMLHVEVPHNIISGNDFDAIQDYTDRSRFRRHWIGPVVDNRNASPGSTCMVYKDYGTSTTPAETSQTSAPYFQKGEWDGETASGYLLPLDSYIRVYLRSPFYINPITQAPRYSTVNVFLAIVANVFVKTDSGWLEPRLSGICRYPIGTGTFPVTAVQGKNGVDGCVNIPVDGTVMSRLWQQTYDYCMSRWSEVDNNYIGITLNDIYLDVGPVEHNTALPSSWDWQPANGNT